MKSLEGVTLREPTESDREGIWRVHDACIRTVYAKAYGAEIAEEWASKRNPSIYSLKPGEWLVASSAEPRRIIGFIHISLEKGELEGMYVHPEVAGGGVGRALLVAGETLLAARGHTTSFVEASVPAEGFYARMGYLAEERKEHDIGLSRRIPCVRMKKKLTPLSRMLAAHVATDEKERADLLAMARYANTLSNPFSRAEREAHFTGSAVVVTPDGKRVCLVHHAKLHRWLQPGGHADAADEGSMAKTALREAGEETGCDVVLDPTAPRPLDVDVHVIPARKDEPEHRHLDVRFLVVARNPSALAHDPNESFGAQWLPFDEAISRADEPALRRLLEKAKRYSAA